MLIANLGRNALRDREVMHGDLPSLHAPLRVAGREPAPDLIRGRGWGVYPLVRLTMSLRGVVVDSSPIYASMKSNASFQRTTRPVDGEGKCAVHISVDVSQKRPNNSRRDFPASAES